MKLDTLLTLLHTAEKRATPLEFRFRFAYTPFHLRDAVNVLYHGSGEEIAAALSILKRADSLIVSRDDTYDYIITAQPIDAPRIDTIPTSFGSVKEYKLLHDDAFIKKLLKGRRISYIAYNRRIAHVDIPITRAVAFLKPGSQIVCSKAGCGLVVQELPELTEDLVSPWTILLQDEVGISVVSPFQTIKELLTRIGSDVFRVVYDFQRELFGIFIDESLVKEFLSEEFEVVQQNSLYDSFFVEGLISKEWLYNGLGDFSLGDVLITSFEKNIVVLFELPHSLFDNIKNYLHVDQFRLPVDHKAVSVHYETAKPIARIYSGGIGFAFDGQLEVPNPLAVVDQASISKELGPYFYTQTDVVYSLLDYLRRVDSDFIFIASSFAGSSLVEIYIPRTSSIFEFVRRQLLDLSVDDDDLDVSVIEKFITPTAQRVTLETPKRAFDATDIAVPFDSARNDIMAGPVPLFPDNPNIDTGDDVGYYPNPGEEEEDIKEMVTRLKEIILRTEEAAGKEKVELVIHTLKNRAKEEAHRLFEALVEMFRSAGYDVEVEEPYRIIVRTEFLIRVFTIDYGVDNLTPYVKVVARSRAKDPLLRIEDLVSVTLNLPLQKDIFNDYRMKHFLSKVGL